MTQRVNGIPTAVHGRVTCAQPQRYRVTQKRELLKNPTKIEEIQEKKCTDRN